MTVGNKYLSLNNGQITQVAATQISAGSTSGGQIVALNTATGLIDISMMPVGIGPEADTLVASETIAAGAFTNKWSNAGVINVRNADATANKPADGFVLAAYASGASATVFRLGQLNNSLTGMTIGSTEFLGTVGARTEIVPTGTGTISQILGVAISATSMAFAPQPPITLA
ncbi:conserved hypothetical protein [Candidatus Desulfosporosinus infrequens]|uniref:Uncharacterized protein n=1 Tax=Candidatus Desulfosporosinus infrequens TaxID=2043169 RepID=A0A2U3L988_9FIRM|nr:conserved hypothetical protein [Candidatus Desulfosporosinus infrequens]